MISLPSRRRVAIVLAPLCLAAVSHAHAQDAPKKQSVDAGTSAGVNSSPLPLKLEPRPTSGAITT